MKKGIQFIRKNPQYFHMALAITVIMISAIEKLLCAKRELLDGTEDKKYPETIVMKYLNNYNMK